MAGISSGQILSIEELTNLGTALLGESVRTWGRITSHDINICQVTLKDSSKEITVDTSFVEPHAFVKGSLYHFIGEIISLPGLPVVLKARIAGCIDGMDTGLFKQALDIRRQYLQESALSKP